MCLGGTDACLCRYFLITPKLLPNLRFHERMKVRQAVLPQLAVKLSTAPQVLIINNGEWLPETFDCEYSRQTAAASVV